jgi:predicted dehydrogenase
MIGVGRQGGDNLMKCCLRIPGIRFVAVADIWESHRTFAQNLLKKYNQPINVYEDYHEMLAKEPQLDAVIIATPDWLHSSMTVDCLKAGKHVYCEKEMSNTLEGAQAMVRAQRETGKLLQIGHQRRSNPRYAHAMKMIYNDKVLGRITNFNGQWNRDINASQDLGWAKKDEIPLPTLQKYGYDSMNHFRNWRWFKKYSGGPIVDLGSHQIEVFSWFLKTHPKAVWATGGNDYYKDREWYDNVMALFEYDTEAGPVRGFYQVLNTSSYGGFFEVFMGDGGSLVISEDERKGMYLPEQKAQKRDWEELSKNKVAADGKEGIELKIGETLDPSGKPTAEGQKMLEEIKKPVHQLHLENFFDAVRGKGQLNSPAELSYESTVSVLKINDAIAAGTRLEYKPEEFKVV